jgi:hypothetical protein
MTTVTQDLPTAEAQSRRGSRTFIVREMWAALAIAVIWLAVLAAAIFGPDIVNNDAGGNHSIVPSAVAVALFAALATWPVAKYGFGGRRDSGA